MAGTDAKVYLSVIPDKNYFLAETNGYPALDYQALTDALRKQTEFAAYIDLFGTLTADDYYRTDSHWRQENLLTTADTLAAAMGVALPDSRYTEWTLDRPYYGVYYGYAALTEAMGLDPVPLSAYEKDHGLHPNFLTAPPFPPPACGGCARTPSLPTCPTTASPWRVTPTTTRATR